MKEWLQSSFLEIWKKHTEALVLYKRVHILNLKLKPDLNNNFQSVFDLFVYHLGKCRYLDNLFRNNWGSLLWILAWKGDSNKGMDWGIWTCVLWGMRLAF